MEIRGIQLSDAPLLTNKKCDMSDYLIAVACGAVAGLVDIFMVGTPGDSVLGTWSDAQVDSAVMKFAHMNGWNPKPGKEDSVASAIGWLEKTFKINYDQPHTGAVGGLFQMSTKNHHMKSLAHSSDVVGLFFSVLNQFTSTSTFVNNGSLITIQTDTFELQGTHFASKLFCGITNWFGHVMSDIAGSSGSRGNAGRGAGVAIPFFELFQFCTFGKFSIGKDRQDLATLATRVFQEGYDARFGLAIAIPVLLCDLTIRLLWAIKQYFYLEKPLKECLPNQTHEDLRVMLLFGHGALCLMDGADAAVRSGGNWLVFFTRMNIIAWTRFIALVLKEVCIRAGISMPLQRQLDAYKQITLSLANYLKELERIDVDAFQRETAQYRVITAQIDQVDSEKELNGILVKSMVDLGIDLPWQGEFDSFMVSKKDHLVFE